MQYSSDKTRTFAYPVAVANIRHPVSFSKANRDVKCLVDSGADFSGIPVPLLNRLRIRADGVPEEVSDYDDRPRLQEFSLVTISLCGKNCGPTRVARLNKKAVPILGRDVLNQFDVRLNGPELVCEIE